jgi:hypothetical protein
MLLVLRGNFRLTRHAHRFLSSNSADSFGPEYPTSPRPHLTGRREVAITKAMPIGRLMISGELPRLDILLRPGKDQLALRESRRQ